jgi:putative ABC transport system permease protein
MTDWTIILRSMSSRLFSTITTIITVAVAVALLLVLVTMREAGSKAFERGCGDMHLLVTAEDSPLVSVLNAVFYANPPRRPLLWARYEQLLKQAPWKYAVPVQQGDSYGGQPVLATSEDFFTKFQPNVGEAWELREGRFFKANFEVVVGAAAARATGLKLNDRIHLTHGSGMSRGDGQAAPHVHEEFTYTVVGILKPTGGSHDRALLTSIESTWLIHAHERIEKEHGHEEHAAKPGEAAHDHAEHADHDDHDEAPITPADLIDTDRKITGVYLRLVTREGSEVPANLQQVFDQLRRDTTINVAAPFSEIRKLDIIVGNVNRLFVAVSLAVLLSSGVAIMLALYNSMEQRRRQIAVLRVLGASGGRIFGLVLTESALIGLIGACAGIALGFIGSVIAAGLMKDQLGLVVSPALSLPHILILLAGTVALASIAGIVPAATAYRTSVASHLRPIG